MSSVLIVEDDIPISNMLTELLQQSGYQTKSAYSGTEALLCIEKENYHLILLDLMLPGLTGQEVIGEVRKVSNVPIIALSAMDQIDTKVELLKKGADDYITKPFNNKELLARIESVLRRNTQTISNIVRYKELSYNKDNYEVKYKDILLTLTKNESKILALLMKNPDKVFTKNNIFELIWQEEYVGEDNTINVHISNIRKKLEIAGAKEEYIQTVWGIGFKMSK